MKLLECLAVLLLMISCAQNKELHKSEVKGKISENKSSVKASTSKRLGGFKVFYPGAIYYYLNDSIEKVVIANGDFVIDTLNSKTRLDIQSDATKSTKIKFSLIRDNQLEAELGTYNFGEFASKYIKWVDDPKLNKSRSIVYMPICGTLQITRVECEYEGSYILFGKFDMVYSQKNLNDTIRVKGDIKKLRYNAYTYGIISEK
ncbi:hypothetical protein DF185_05245 [Marinifilum breve]|uniref:DUF4251 domain-containing protein n=1 Tax=Marinifilum breve TaxID=2184082 RepID=A0A2V4A0H6_9BACT|nr:hypothetical protein [Marinifilum breve]PXY02051.1 hypothetical protein DF185_05245 [Marinifilum breve]